MPIICATSGYSYMFLNNQTVLLYENLATKIAPKEKRIIIHNPKNNSSKIVIIAPPKSTNFKNEKEEQKENYANKDKNSLPDIEFLKFIIKKGKEGIPVLKFNNFLSLF